LAKVFTAKGIVELALQLVSEFALHDIAADADSLRRGLDWFNLNASHILSTDEPLWLQGEDVSIPIPANPGAWDFVAAAGTALIPANRLQIVKTAHLKQTSTGNVTPLTLVNKEEWEQLGDHIATGRPDFLFIDRQENNPLAYFDPAITVTGYELELSYYATSRTMTNTGGHDFASYSQLYVVWRLGRQLASGPVVRLGNDRLTDMDNQIKMYRYELDRAIRQTKTPIVVAPRRVC